MMKKELHNNTQADRDREKKSFEFVIPASTFFFFILLFFTNVPLTSLSFSIFCVLRYKRARPPEAGEKRDEDKMVAAAKWKRRRDGGPGKRSFYFFPVSLSLSLSPELSFAPVLRFLDVHTHTPFPQRIRNKKTQQPTGELVEAFFYIFYTTTERDTVRRLLRSSLVAWLKTVAIFSLSLPSPSNSYSMFVT